MADPIYKDSSYKFTDPIRYFKANDPYYWEVENIPLKQIHSNMLWLKDQIGPEESQLPDVGRRDLSELKPYVNGEDNIIRVKPGRYTARINDAYKLDPLAFFEKIAGADFGVEDRWKIKRLNHEDVLPVISRLKTRVQANFIGLNGLESRVFTYPVKTVDEAHKDWIRGHNALVGGYTGPHLMDRTHPGNRWATTFPLTDGTHLNARFSNHTDEAEHSRSNFHWWENGGFAYTGEQQHVLRWRGPARTAVVDVPEELSMAIPAFNVNSYFYTDEDGKDVLVSGVTNRIDLLFVYSKPVDASSSYIGEYTGDTFTAPGDPTMITKAELGIVYGAGIGMKFKEEKTPLDPLHKNIVDLQDEEGNHLMLPNASDQLMTDAGFTKLGVHGSFPAPDDLMNVSPLLAEDLETDNPMLIGQSILPLAYIVTTNADSLNRNTDNVILTEDSIIDIRPFLRTAELAYNERAGIAAAMPQISIANPAVGKAQLDREMMRAKEYIDSEVASHAGTTHGGTTTTKTIIQGASGFPRVVGSGYVFGGTLFGPEAVLWHNYSNDDRSGGSLQDDADIKAKIVEVFSYPGGTNLPDYPQWDLAMWNLGGGEFPGAGTFPADWINNHISYMVGQGLGAAHPFHHPVDLGCVSESVSVDQNTSMERMLNFSQNDVRGNEITQVFFVKKTIPINRGLVNWMSDYNVKVELENCVSLSNNAGYSGRGGFAGQFQGSWVEKKETEFTIYVAWVGKTVSRTDWSENRPNGSEFESAQGYGGGGFGNGSVMGSNGWMAPYNDRAGRHWAAFAVLNTEFLSDSRVGLPSQRAFKGDAKVGSCIYPTVSFTIFGIPSAFKGHTGNGLGEGVTLDLY